MSTTDKEDGENARLSKGIVKRIREQGVRLKHLLIKSGASAGMVLGAWLVGYFQYSVTWVLVPSFVYIGIVEYRKWRKSAAGVQDDEQSLLGRVEELPSWVSIYVERFVNLRSLKNVLRSFEIVRAHFDANF